MEEIIELIETNNFDENNNIIEKIIKLDDIEISNNIFVSYINGNFDEKHMDFAKKEIYNIFKNNDLRKAFKNFINKCNIDYDMFEYFTNFNNYKIIEFVWKNENFRNHIKHVKKFSTAKEYHTYGIFKKYNLSDSEYVQKYFTCLEKLIYDKSIHEYLIDYLYDIIHLNEPYTSINHHELVKEKKCSNFEFNLFILETVYKLYQQYDFNDLSKSHNKIYETMMLGLHIVLQCTYITFNKEANKFLKNDINRKKRLDLINNFLKKQLIQDIFHNHYENLFVKKTIENKDIDKKYEYVPNDILLYADFMNNYDKKFTLSKNTLNIISHILGNNKHNVHNRYYSLIITKNMSYKYGYLEFDDYFNNLFKYINEVNLIKLSIQQLSEKIKYHHTITNILLQMTDLVPIISEKSRYILPETIFRLISNSFELFDNFNNDLYDKIKGNFLEEMYYYNCYSIMIECTIYTIRIYTNIYQRNLITTYYPELEEKYHQFIGRIINNIKMKENNKFQFDLNLSNDNSLINLCCLAICENIDKNNINENFIDIKDNVIQVLKTCENSTDKINKFLTLLENKKNTFDEDKIPNDLLDPLTCKIIKNPVMIPNNNEIFERSSIVMQIYEHGINPYTREPLSLEILEKFNEKEETKQKINIFLDKKNNFEKEIKK